MQTFTIDGNDRITVVAEGQEAPEASEGFQTEQELASLAATWPSSRFVAIWNQLPGIQPVKKFTDRKTAVKRIWKAVQSPQSPDAVAVRGRKQPKPGRQRRSKQKDQASRVNTKAATVIALLEQPTGASLKTIMSATGWQAHSVRGYISGQLRKRLGLRVKSLLRDGERIYLLRK